MNFIKEKKNVLLFIVLSGILFLTLNVYLPGYVDSQVLSLIWYVTFFLSPLYGATALFLLFFKEKLLKSWFIYSLFFTAPIIFLLSLITLYPNNSGFVGGEVLVLLPIALLAILLFITTPFYLHLKNKKIQSAK